MQVALADLLDTGNDNKSSINTYRVYKRLGLMPAEVLGRLISYFLFFSLDVVMSFVYFEYSSKTCDPIWKFSSFYIILDDIK